MDRAQRRRAARLQSVPNHRPSVQLDGYRELQVVLPNPEVSENELEAEIHNRQDQYGEVETVDRPAQSGDRVLLQIDGSVNGEHSDDFSSPTYLCELGKGAVSPHFDAQIEGLSAEDEVTFDEVMSDTVVTFTVTVKEVQVRTPATVDDAFVQRVSPKKTVEEWRELVELEMRVDRKAQAQSMLGDRSVEALGALVRVDELPLMAIEAEYKRQMSEILTNLEEKNLTFERYLELRKQTEAQFSSELRAELGKAFRAHIALLALAHKESVEATPEEIEAARLQINKDKAKRWLTEHVELVDAQGNAIERTALA